MINISDLISVYCSKAVTFKRLSELVEIKRGQRVTKGYLNENGQYPVISGGVTPMGYLNEYNRDENTITVAQYGTAGYVSWQKSKFWANDVCYSIYPKEVLVNRFLFHYLLHKQNEIYSMKTNAIPAHLPQEKFSSLLIPLPSIKVQNEIVQILDNFKGLTEELTEELKVRKQQYNYYLNEMYLELATKKTNLMKFHEIGTIERGNGLQKSDFTEIGVPCIHYGQIYTYFGTYTSKTKSYVSLDLAKKLKKVNFGDLIIAVTSENIEDVCKSVLWLGEEEIVTGGHTAIFRHNQNPKYIAYFVKTNIFFNQKKKIAHGTKVIEVTPKKLENIIIPIPTLDEQQKIVDILDRFDKLVNDIGEGIPAEIAARQKQYEYYRDKLLTFKEVGNESI